MDRRPPTIDMLPDGSFRTVHTGRLDVPFSAKLLTGAVLVGGLALCLGIAAVAAWILSMVLPVLVIAAGVAWLALKWRRWQGRGTGPSPAWMARSPWRQDR